MSSPACASRSRAPSKRCETSNEELRCTNEELQSANEELQSTNEELETSKEELQSVNEELMTVNTELQKKLEELSHANNDLTNLLNSTDIGTIFLDNDLNIKRYTPAVVKLINLIPTDVGRPVRDIVSQIVDDDLVDNAREVLRTLMFHEAEMRTKDGRCYLRRILPYKTADNMIDGVVVAFVNITEVREAQRMVEAILTYANSLVNAFRQPVVLLNKEGRVVQANQSFYTTFRTHREDTLSHRFVEMDRSPVGSRRSAGAPRCRSSGRAADGGLHRRPRCAGGWSTKAAARRPANRLWDESHRRRGRAHGACHRGRHGEPRVMRTPRAKAGHLVEGLSRNGRRGAQATTRLGPRPRARRPWRTAGAFLRRFLAAKEPEQRNTTHLFQRAPVGLLVIDQYGRLLDINPRGALLLGRRRGEVLGKPVANLVDPADRRNYHLHVADAACHAEPVSCRLTFSSGTSSTGLHAYVETVCTSVREGKRRYHMALTQFIGRVGILQEREGLLRGEIAAAEARFERVAAVGALTGALDLDNTVKRAVRLPLPSMASLCVIDLRDGDDHVRQVAAASSDGCVPPLDPYASQGSAHVVRLGTTRVLLEASPANLVGLASEPSSLPALRRAIKSYLCIPLGWAAAPSAP